MTMGSIVARPKKPQIATSTTTSPTTTSPGAGSGTGTTTGATTGTTGTTTSDPTDPVKARVENVLRRNRGLLGNVLTGFRGVLDSQSARPQRKTLLGE